MATVIQPTIDTETICQACKKNAIVKLFERYPVCLKHFNVMKNKINNFDTTKIQELRTRRMMVSNLLNKPKEELAEKLYDATKEIKTLKGE